MWLSGTAALAAALTVIGLFYSNTGEQPAPSRSAGPVRPTIVPRTPKTVPLGARGPEVRRVAAKFVATAVVRKHLEQSYDLVAPQLRQGLTRKQWMTGSIPVVPYSGVDFAFAKMKVSYSYANRVGLVVGLFPKKAAKTPYEAFNLELTAYKRGVHERWLVDSWAPAGIGIGSPNGPPLSSSRAVQSRPSLSRLWILFPICFLLGLMILVPGSLTLRGWVRNRRARRRIYDAL
jgi:hypothetical protein